MQMWFRRWVGVAASLGAAAAVLVALPHAGFQVDSPATGLAPSVSEQVVGGGADGEPVAASPGGPQEGIQVHGSWTIEVLEPDGQPVSRHEFENSLTSTGAARLPRFLGREDTVGFWVVTVQGSANANHPCRLTATITASCVVFESASGVTEGGHRFKNLTVSVPTSGTDVNKLVLSGTATAARAGDVGRVTTEGTHCLNTVAPSNCNIELYESFTDKTLATPIPVSQGQIIQVKVAIGFS